MAAFRRLTVGLSPDLRTSGPAGPDGPAVSIMLVAGGKIEADNHRHVALCAGRAMQFGAVAGHFTVAFGEREREKSST